MPDREGPGWSDLSAPKSVYEGKPMPMGGQLGLPAGQTQRAAASWLEPPWVARAIRLGWVLAAALIARAVIDGARLCLSIWRVLG